MNEPAEVQASETEELNYEFQDADQALAVVDETSVNGLVNDGGARAVLRAVAEWARPQVFDLDTKKGRQNLEGLARRVGGIKGRVDEKLKAAIQEMEASIVPYKKERNALGKAFEKLQEELREPLAEIAKQEQEEAQQKAMIDDMINQIRAMGDPIQDGEEVTVEYLEAALKEINEMELSEELYGDRIQEAAEALLLAKKTCENSINAAKYLASQQADAQERAPCQDTTEAVRVPGPTEAEVVSRVERYGDPAGEPMTATQVINRRADTSAERPEDRKEREKQQRRAALEAMKRFRFPNDAEVTREEIYTQIIAAVHLGQVPHMKMDYS